MTNNFDVIELLDTPKTAKARRFATRAHSKQKYGEQPYTIHLQDVARLVQFFTINSTLWFAEIENLVCAAWLHDVVEDTSTSMGTIYEKFGTEIGELVWAVTTPPNEKHPLELRYKTLGFRIERVPLAELLKLADRYANVLRGEKNDMYRKHQPLFSKYCRSAGSRFGFVWDELEKELTRG